MRAIQSCSRPRRCALPLPRLSLLATCVAAGVLLSACGGGSGNGMVRNDPPPPPPPTVVKLVMGLTQTMTNINIPGTLTVEGDGVLNLRGTGTVAGDTTVTSGTVRIQDRLTSKITVETEGRLEAVDVVGDILNRGMFEPIRHDYADYDCFYYQSSCDFDSDITGSYRQASSATMRMQLGLNGIANPILDVTGTVTLEGGTLELFGDFVTSTPYTEWLIHAGGGVTGQFDRWTSPGLFIDGSLRYAPNDVYFDIVRSSIQSAMASAGVGDALTLSSAAHLDHAFAHADDFAALPSANLNEEQQRFLRYAAAIQRIGDYAQAQATLDSLSGHAHADAQQRWLEQMSRPAPQLSARLDRLQYDGRAGAWAGTRSDGRIAGHDQWLNGRILLGSSFGWNDTPMQFERQGGQTRAAASHGNVYLHYRATNGSYLSGQAGYGRARLTVNRPLDFGAAGQQIAHSERDLELAQGYVETGRAFAVGRGWLTPFASLGYAALHSEGFVEEGNTGFELAVQPARSDQVTAGVGARFARDWRFGGDGWLRLDLDARYQHGLGRNDPPLRAAFSGAPLAQFDLSGLPSDGAGWLGLGLTGGYGDTWSWYLRYDNARVGPERDGWTLGLKHTF